jgi:hypothetical protein
MMAPPDLEGLGVEGEENDHCQQSKTSGAINGQQIAVHGTRSITLYQASKRALNTVYLSVLSVIRNEQT